MNDIKPLTIKETSLKEEMKSRCLNKGQYTDKNAEEKFKMLCHLEDFEIGYWELQQERDKYKSIVNRAIDKIEQLRFEKWSIMGTDIMDLLDILDGKELEEGNSNE